MRYQLGRSQALAAITIGLLFSSLSEPAEGASASSLHQSAETRAASGAVSSVKSADAEMIAQASKGNAEAQWLLGKAYMNGAGVTKNTELGMEWYAKAAEGGHAEAQFAVGLALVLARKDPTGSKWLRKAAEQGHPLAWSTLWMATDDAAASKDPTDPLASTLTWIRYGADRSVPMAERLLGRRLWEGTDGAPDHSGAVVWFRRAADQGDADAAFYLGVAHKDGKGVTQDLRQSLTWFLRSAEQGNKYAQYNVGLAYADGTGIPQDYSRAAVWFQKAADQGQAGAQYALGRAYANGEGVLQDYVRAHMWTNLATARADADVRERFREGRDLVEGKMTATQVAEAQKLAREWLANFERRPK